SSRHGSPLVACSPDYAGANPGNNGCVKEIPKFLSRHVARIRRSRNPGRHGHPGTVPRLWPVPRITLALIRATMVNNRPILTAHK
ncbi:hypothetical protein, partial [Legionella sp. CNM-4043-24]|uniref:hypothetical protein n=1 Tax=Legionella sp. CNM-4043-24 TaxID=3421646 RepID=UPI00403B2499